MAPNVKQQRKKEKKSIVELFPEMLISALSRNDDFIITFEIHPDKKKRYLHVLQGKLITPCMLGTLKNRVELQQEEGGSIMTMHWGKTQVKICQVAMSGIDPFIENIKSEAMRIDS
jgi:hypothetical protein